MVLSPHSTPTDLEPLAAVREPRKGGGGSGLRTTTSSTKNKTEKGEERQISFFKKENRKPSKDCANKDNVSNALTPLV